MNLYCEFSNKKVKHMLVIEGAEETIFSLNTIRHCIKYDFNILISIVSHCIMEEHFI